MYNRVREDSAHFLLPHTQIDVGVASLNGIIVKAATVTRLILSVSLIWEMGVKLQVQ